MAGNRWVKLAIFSWIFLVHFDLAKASPVLLAGSGEEKVRVTHVLIAENEVERRVHVLATYQGPKSPFAMIVAVPRDVSRADVGAIPVNLFDRIDRLSAPRFADFWEKHPCEPGPPEQSPLMQPKEASPERTDPAGSFETSPLQALEHSAVTEVFVGDQNELEMWLDQRDYALPSGAAEAISEAREQGARFVALAMDVEKLSFFDDDSAPLVPLSWTSSRKHTTYSRLGLPSIFEGHDLYIYTLSSDGRFEVENYPTRIAATNLRVDAVARTHMGELYVALYDDFSEKHPDSFVLEYAWPASSCGPPCGTPPLTPSDVARLGASPGAIITRLHYRYERDQLPRSPRLSVAPPIHGGVALPKGAEGRADTSVTPSNENRFVTRFVHTHSYGGPVDCPRPVRSRWGRAPVPPPDTTRVFSAVNMSHKHRDHIDPARVLLDEAEWPRSKFDYGAAADEVVEIERPLFTCHVCSGVTSLRGHGAISLLWVSLLAVRRRR